MHELIGTAFSSAKTTLEIWPRLVKAFSVPRGHWRIFRTMLPPMLMTVAKVAAPVANALFAARGVKKIRDCANVNVNLMGQALRDAATILSNGVQEAADRSTLQAVRSFENQLHNVLLREEEWRRLLELCRNDAAQAGLKCREIMEEYLHKGCILVVAFLVILAIQAGNLFLISMAILVVPFVNNNVDLLQEILKVLLLAVFEHGSFVTPYILRGVLGVAAVLAILKLAAPCSKMLSRFGSNIPVGTVVAFAGREVPAGYLVCNGEEHSTSMYPELAHCLTLEGHPSETFRVPDLRGQFIVGAGHGEGLENRTRLDRGGREEVALDIENLPAHTHHLSFQSMSLHHELGPRTQVPREDRYQERVTRHVQQNLQIQTQSTGESRPFNIMPPWLALEYHIKALP